jgi:uncharacterized metal-binding protein
MEDKEQTKVALAACSGMSPNGLITRVACSDTVENSKQIISICMGATSADREGFRKLIKKYPIIAVNGCEAACVDNILEGKGVKSKKSLNASALLREKKLNPTLVSRLDEEGEKSVKEVTIRIKEILENFKTKS